MKRRSFITLVGGAAAWPLAARAHQHERVRRIGFLGGAARPVSLEPSFYGGLLRGLRELGYVEGRDFVMDWRFAEGRNEIIPALAAELVRSNVDVIVLGTSTAVRPTQQLTQTGLTGRWRCRPGAAGSRPVRCRWRPSPLRTRLE